MISKESIWIIKMALWDAMFDANKNVKDARKQYEAYQEERMVDSDQPDIIELALKQRYDTAVSEREKVFSAMREVHEEQEMIKRL